MARRGQRRVTAAVKIRTVLIILLPMALIALVLLVLASLPSGPPWIAEEPPQEDRRIVHPKGFSIVKPPGWFAQIEQEGNISEDVIRLRATEKRLRSYTGISVTAFPSTPLSS